MYERKTRPLEDYIGEKFNYLTITGIDRERRKREQSCNTYVFADCDCGVCGKSYNFNKIKRGETKSCGHLKKKHDKPTKNNLIEYYDNYGIIYTSKSKYLFDLDDEWILKNKYWYTDGKGYLTHCYMKDRKNYYIKFHREVMNAKDGEYVDHINRDITDNRKSNLRLCTHNENDINKGLSVRNKSGYIGVSWIKRYHVWKASITKSKKDYNLGYYKNIDDAIKARLRGEIILFKEFAPQKHLYEKYFSEEEIDEIRKYESL